MTHTMRLFPPPCLTVGVMVLSESGSPFFFHVHIGPSIWSNPVYFGLIWPQDPLPILHCPVFMVPGKFEVVQSMSLLEKRTFPLDNSMKIILFECVSDCLGCDRIRKNVVDKMGGLHSIIKSSTGDLTNNWLLVTWRQLGRSSSFAAFYISSHLLLNSPNSRLP